MSRAAKKSSHNLTELLNQGIDQNKAYDVKTENGVDLPFDFVGKGNIDLVVGQLKDKSGSKNVTPGDLLSDFDLGKIQDTEDFLIGIVSPPLIE